jgi:hypothetical protein
MRCHAAKFFQDYLALAGQAHVFFEILAHGDLLDVDDNLYW